MSFLSGRRLSALALVVLLALGACGGDGDSGDGSAGGSTPGVQEGGDGAGEGGSGGSDGDAAATPGAAEGTPGEGAGGDPDARFNLIASPDNVECNYIPNGHLSGADQLSVQFYFLIIGGNPGDVPLLPVVASSDTGLQASFNAGPHNQAVSVAQLALRGGDFGRRHTITLTVDSSNQVPETDESDNRIRVSVELPSPRPNSVVDPLPCSASPA